MPSILDGIGKNIVGAKWKFILCRRLAVALAPALAVVLYVQNQTRFCFIRLCGEIVFGISCSENPSTLAMAFYRYVQNLYPNDYGKVASKWTGAA